MIDPGEEHHLADLAEQVPYGKETVGLRDIVYVAHLSRLELFDERDGSHLGHVRGSYTSSDLIGEGLCDDLA